MQLAIEPSWQQPAEGLSEANLRALLAGEVPALRMAGFATAAECRAYGEAIRAAADQASAAKTARMALLGINFSNHTGSREDYFAQVPASYAITSAIARAAGFDPLARIIAQLAEIWPAAVGPAEEPGHGRFFAGGIKTRAASGNLHYDFAPHTAHGYAIERITDQLGWNLYLDMPATTGQTTTYRREIPRVGGAIGGGVARSLNITPDYVADCESFTFHPTIGDAMIINTRFPHDIIVEDPRPGDQRVQTSAFIGRLPDDRLVLWS